MTDDTARMQNILDCVIEPMFFLYCFEYKDLTQEERRQKLREAMIRAVPAGAFPKDFEGDPADLFMFSEALPVGGTKPGMLGKEAGVIARFLVWAAYHYRNLAEKEGLEYKGFEWAGRSWRVPDSN